MMDSASQSQAVTTQRKPRWRQLLTTLLTIALAGLFLWLATRNLDWQHTLEVARTADVLPLLLIPIFYSGAFLARGLRWQLLLQPHVRRSQAVWGVCVGYLGNTFLPARAGEGMRTIMIARTQKTNTSFVLATVVVERLLDALIQVIIFSLLFRTIVSTSDVLNAAVSSIVIIGVVSLVLLLALPMIEAPMLAIMRRSPLPQRFLEPLTAQLAQFVMGVRVIRRGRILLGFSLYSALAMLIELTALRQTALAFDVNMPLNVSLFFYTCLGLSSALPSTPGAVGIFQFVAVTVLVPLGFADENVLVFITVFQAQVIAAVLASGLVGLWRIRANSASENG